MMQFAFRRATRRALLLAVCSVMVGDASAHATVMVERSIDELAAEADAVVRGTVIRTGTRVRIVRGVIEPETHTWIKVHEWVRGEPGPGQDRTTVELREPGGASGDVTVSVSGVPAYEVGEDVMVFLRREGLARGTRGPAWRTLEMVQGKLRVVADGRLERTFADVSLLRWKRGRSFLEEAVRPQRFDLADVLARVRAARAKALVPRPIGGRP